MQRFHYEGNLLLEEIFFKWKEIIRKFEFEGNLIEFLDVQRKFEEDLLIWKFENENKIFFALFEFCQLPDVFFN